MINASNADDRVGGPHLNKSPEFGHMGLKLTHFGIGINDLLFRSCQFAGGLLMRRLHATYMLSTFC